MKKLLIILPVLPLLFLSACTKKESGGTKVPGVRVAQVLPKTISRTIIVSGTVESKSSAWLIAPTDGIISEILKNEGDSVRQGDIVCLIMPLEQHNMIGQAKADYELAVKEKSDSQSADKLTIALQRYEAAKKLYKPVPVASPITGTVILRNDIDVGENVNARQNLMAIADMGRLIVKTAVSETYSELVSVGTPVKVKTGGLSVSFDAAVALASPGVNPESRTFDMEIKLPQHAGIKPGMTATVEIAVKSKKGTLAVPQDALVVKPDGSKYVFTVADSKAKLRKVTVGLENNQEIEVTEGLSAGDSVVVMGAEGLKDGISVKISGGVQKQPQKAAGK